MEKKQPTASGDNSWNCGWLFLHESFPFDVKSASHQANTTTLTNQMWLTYHLKKCDPMDIYISNK